MENLKSIAINGTKAELEMALADTGIYGTPAGDLLIRATARARHERRVRATVEAAKKAASGDEYLLHEKVVARAIALLVLDLHGRGGPYGAGSYAGIPSTDRLPAFRQLGTGRWNADDGRAYRAAAIEAAWRLLVDLGVGVSLWHAYVGPSGVYFIGDSNSDVPIERRPGIFVSWADLGGDEPGPVRDRVLAIQRAGLLNAVLRDGDKRPRWAEILRVEWTAASTREWCINSLRFIKVL